MDYLNLESRPASRHRAGVAPRCRFLFWAVVRDSKEPPLAVSLTDQMTRATVRPVLSR